jgi:hypothetical protein
MAHQVLLVQHHVQAEVEMEKMLMDKMAVLAEVDMEDSYIQVLKEFH